MTTEELAKLLRELICAQVGKAKTFDYDAMAAAILARYDLVEKWVPVSERLPEHDNNNVLVWCAENRCSYTAYRNGGKWWWFGGLPARQVYPEVTAWRPLPAAPEKV